MQIFVAGRSRKREVTVLLTKEELGQLSPGFQLAGPGGVFKVSTEPREQIRSPYCVVLDSGAVVLFPCCLLDRLKEAGRTKIEAISFKPEDLCSCGRPFSADDKFCGGCGAEIKPVRLENAHPFADTVRYVVEDFDQPEDA